VSVSDVKHRLRVCAIDDVMIGGRLQVDLPGLPTLAVFRVAHREFHCTDDLCTHGNASLSAEGELQGHVVECGWHGGKFDVRTGEACGPPCVEPLKTYPVSLDDGAVYIEA
jgi:nitrite reductase/ring-hydroxylating ferredoxin subunit